MAVIPVAWSLHSYRLRDYLINGLSSDFSPVLGSRPRSSGTDAIPITNLVILPFVFLVIFLAELENYSFGGTSYPALFLLIYI